MSTQRPDDDASSASDAVNTGRPDGEAGDATEAADATKAGEAAEVTEAADASDTADASDAAETSDAAEAAEISEAAEVTDDAEAAEVADITESGEGVAGADEGVPRRRRSPVAVVSVAAAVLLVGGGGAYFTATATGGSGGRSTGPGGDGTPPPLALDGYSEGGSPGIAVGEPNPYGASYRADGKLPGGPDSAPVYRATGEVTKDEVARLARALEVAGTPRLTGDAWTVGAVKDGSGPTLRVTKRAPGIWTFSRYTPGTDNLCTTTKACPSKSPGRSAADPVSEAGARKAAAPVLKAVGQDDAKLNAGQVMDRVRVVNAEPKVGGLPTHGWTTGIQVGADGQVVGGSGNLKAPEKSDTYPVIGAQKTLDLMNGSTTGDGRKGIGGCASPVPLKDKDETPCEASTATPTRESVAVEGAVFGLASHVVDGRPALVPSWLFDVRPKGADDAFTVTYPAVDPRYLAVPGTSGPTEPSQAPSGSPTPRPSDGSTSAPTKRDVKVDGYAADGKDLTVSFTGGVCGDYAASASESSGEVKVTVTETPWQGKVCIMIAKEYDRTLHLDAPLGDRKVVGSDGKEIPKETAAEHRLPKSAQSAQPQ
ncbi:hypothetical protein [Streptomyces avermitilis]|uniref:hypothetical protein n=1 Tax=Streptomyces avermitilis TaxID=33903 RepID=UPI0033F46CF9